VECAEICLCPPPLDLCGAEVWFSS
jgi:hypothetical protein